MAVYIEDIRQGDTRVFQIDYGQGVDITGWKFYFLLRTKLTDLENVVQVFNTAGDNPADDILNGLAHLTLPANVSADIDPGKYFYAIKVDKGAGVIHTILPGLLDPCETVLVLDGIEIL